MKVLFAGESRNIKSCPLHTHSCAELIITLKGEASTFVNDEEIPVVAGTVTLMPSGVSHSHFSKMGYSDIFVHIESLDMPLSSPSFCLDETGAVLQLGKMLCAVFVQREKNYQAICDALLSTIFEYIIKLSGGETKYEFVQKFKDILALRHSDIDLSISREAAKIGVSFDYMRHCFKEETGQTPLEYLTKIRINQAKRHLRQNKFYSVGEVAALCGFSDRYYFSRVFKKQTGVSPQKYKEMGTPR